jgi:hypothetical protein
MCRIVNFKVYGSKEALNKAFGNHWTYIGRANRYAGLPQSPLANPFKASAFGGQQGATLPHYRRWLWKRIQDGDEGVVTALRDITEDSVLVCYCKPGPCHGDVVKAAAAWQRKARLETTGIAVFVSGHRDLTPVEFAEHYMTRLDEAVSQDCRFVVGDAPGADAMAQLHVAQRVDRKRVTVFHAGQQPRFNNGFHTSGGYRTQTAKDAAMTRASDEDSARVRPGKNIRCCQ